MEKILTNAFSPTMSHHPAVNTDALQEGDRLSLVRYLRVTDASPQTSVVVHTDVGQVWSVDRAIIRNTCYSASQYHAVQTVTRTRIAYLLEHAGDAIFTVTFCKKPDVNAIADSIAGLPGDIRTVTQAARRKMVREWLAGQERTLVGYLKSAEPDINGRIRVIDLEAPAGSSAERLVDPRTIEKLILKNVLYGLKQ